MKTLGLFVGILTYITSALAADLDGIDSYRWFLSPNGQKIEIDIDDIHSEIITASPKVDWGWKSILPNSMNRTVRIAVLDGGVDIEHPEIKAFVDYNQAECLENNVIPPKDGEDKDKNGYKGDCAGWNFADGNNRAEDEDGHGTHVAGIITTILRNNIGSVKILPIKVFAAGEGTSSTKSKSPLPTRLAEGLEYAISRNVDVIHLSGGWPKEIMNQRLQTAIEKAKAQGIAIIVASGNSSQRAAIWPCRMPGVLCVGALRPDGTVANFSNFGQQVDLYAPGEKILSTIPKSVSPLHFSRQGYDYKNGTSQAAPIVTAAYSYLLGIRPTETRDDIFARLYLTAEPSVNGEGLKNLFHLDRAANLEINRATVVPQFKGVLTATFDRNGVATISFPLVNLTNFKSAEMPLEVSCSESQASASPKSMTFEPRSSQTLTISFRNPNAGVFSKCTIKIGENVFQFEIKNLKELPAPNLSYQIKSATPLILPKPYGASSRLVTLPTIGGTPAQSIYYLAGVKEPTILYRDQILPGIKIPDNCQHLRFIQTDIDGDGQNEIIHETMCDKKFLNMEFFDKSLNSLFGKVKHEPHLTTLNYDNFQVIYNGPQTPPSIQFLNSGFLADSPNPWEPSNTGMSRHLYLLTPILKDKTWEYIASCAEDIKKWSQQLGLRFVPAYQTLHLVGDQLLVRMQGKTVWVNIKTQEPRWAGLDDVFWGGDTFEKAWTDNASGSFNLLITPYDFRSFVLGGPVLRFLVENKSDPIIGALTTFRTGTGYRIALRSYLKLWFLDYDNSGVLIKKTALDVDRFDFIGFQDQKALINTIVSPQGPIFIIDGSRISSQYLDIVKYDGSKRSFEIPTQCASQTPVAINSNLFVPLACSIDKDTVEMRFVPLND